MADSFHAHRTEHEESSGLEWDLSIYSDANLPSPAESVHLFGSASLVIGMHGAGLVHALFCEPAAQMIEFALPEPHAH